MGSTPAHNVVRDFLDISLIDSIDFMRWRLEIRQGAFELESKYGLSKPGTPGFENEKIVVLKGKVQKIGNIYHLLHAAKKVALIEVNPDLLHFADQNQHMLIGNGGYSYALNNTSPRKTDQFTIQAAPVASKAPLVFEGRTPCQELSDLLKLDKSDACNKMKWYIIFYTDSLTGKPSYYLKGGIGYRKETMERGKWQIIKGKDGRIIYKVTPDNRAYTLHLLKGDDNILFFIQPDGRLLVGNEDFSYTLNRRNAEYPPVRR